MTISETQTYSWIIRNVFFDALRRDQFFANYTMRKTKRRPVQPEHLPYLGVYIVDDTMVPDGDGNHGCVRLSHTLRLGYSVMIANNDRDQAESQIDFALKRIMSVFADPYIMNVLDTYSPQLGFDNPDNTRIESINRATRRHVFGSAGLNNETALSELQFEMSCFYREDFPPVITDDLLEIDMTTGIKIGETPEEMAQRQQVQAKYIFTPATQAKAPTPQQMLAALRAARNQEGQ
jgi:hypothetical protein